LKSVELYSPIGDCQYSLAPLPVDLLQHVVFRFEDTIMACSGILVQTKIFTTRWAIVLFKKCSDLKDLVLPIKFE
jgi:hypothetical protein